MDFRGLECWSTIVHQIPTLPRSFRDSTVLAVELRRAETVPRQVFATPSLLRARRPKPGGCIPTLGDDGYCGASAWQPSAIHVRKNLGTQTA
jgi:hypothetical protein